MSAVTDPWDMSGLALSAVALNRRVDAFSDEEFGAPSLLPGWTRSHVVAHLALNGEALAGVLDGLARGERRAMYASDAHRNADIEGLAHAGPSELRNRLLAATTAFSDAVEALDPENRRATVLRLPEGPEWSAALLVPRRWSEVEIHHADLGAGYTAADWPLDFAEVLLDEVIADREQAGRFRVEATDLNETWVIGDDGGPVISGPAGLLGWWLSGRGHGEGLASTSETLPELGPWLRSGR